MKDINIKSKLNFIVKQITISFNKPPIIVLLAKSLNTFGF